MRDSNLMRLLEPQVTRPVGLVDRLTVAKGAKAVRSELSILQSQGVAHVVIDAVANDDLTTIADACRDMPLMTGGSAIAMPLPALHGFDGVSFGTAKPHLGAGGLVISGSCSAMTNRQVADYLAQGKPAFRLDPSELAESGSDAALAWLASQDLSSAPLIYATADPASVKAAQEKLGVQQAGAIVETALARCAVSARDAGARRIVVAGGETSGAVAKALGVDRLNIGTEIAPGVPWTFCKSGGHDIALALKSGNFGAETFFTDAFDLLETP
jgi:uncharacterized protein YgbK (DUF1537 family)